MMKLHIKKEKQNCVSKVTTQTLTLILLLSFLCFSLSNTKSITFCMLIFFVGFRSSSWNTSSSTKRVLSTQTRRQWRVFRVCFSLLIRSLLPLDLIFLELAQFFIHWYLPTFLYLPTVPCRQNLPQFHPLRSLLRRPMNEMSIQMFLNEVKDVVCRWVDVHHQDGHRQRTTLHQQGFHTLSSSLFSLSFIHKTHILFFCRMQSTQTQKFINNN